MNYGGSHLPPEARTKVGQTNRQIETEVSCLFGFEPTKKEILAL